MTTTTSEAGRLGAEALNAKLTAKQRSANARKAARARWGNLKPEQRRIQKLKAELASLEKPKAGRK